MQQKSELPEGWTWTTIENITIDVKNIKPENDPNRDFKYIDISSIDNHKFSIFDCKEFKGIDAPSRARRPIKQNDVLFSNVRTYLKNIAIVPEEYDDQLCSTGFTVLRPSFGILPKYLFIFVQTNGFIDLVTPQQKGSQYPATSDKVVKSAEIPLPPIAEQHRIVSAIEALFARLDATNEKLDRVPEILKKFRESVLAAACDGRLTKNWRAENPNIEDAFELLNQITNEKNLRFSQKETSIKKSITLEVQKKSDDEPFEIPEKWIWIIWNDIVDWITYGFTRPMPHVEEGIPIITAKNVQNGYIDYSIYDMTTEEAFSELSDKDKPKLNEILIVKDGATIGRAAIVDTESIFCINQSVALLRFGGMTAYIPFLLKVIQSKFTQDLIWANAKGSAMPHISITKFGKLPLPLPPLPEQKEIVRRVDALFAFADSIESNVAAAREKTEKLRQSILAKAFSGQLVETEAEIAKREGRDYETAEILLERIKAENGKIEKKR